MPQESTTPDLAELVRQLLDATSRADLTSSRAFTPPNAVWDSSRGGLEVVEGVAAIRRLNEDWFAVYEDWDAFDFACDQVTRVRSLLRHLNAGDDLLCSAIGSRPGG